MNPRMKYECIATYRGHDHAVESLLILGSRLLSVSYDGTLRVWNPEATGEVAPLETVKLSLLPVRRLIQSSKKPNMVLTAGYDGFVFGINIESMRLAFEWTSNDLCGGEN